MPRRGYKERDKYSRVSQSSRIMRQPTEEVLASRIYKTVFFGGKRLTQYPWEESFKDQVRRYLSTCTNYRKMLLGALIAREVLMRGAITTPEAAERFGDQIHTKKGRTTEVSKVLKELGEAGLVKTMGDLAHITTYFHDRPDLLAKQLGEAMVRKSRFEVRRRGPKRDFNQRLMSELRKRGLLKHIEGKRISPKTALHKARLFDLYGRKVEPDKLTWNERELVAYLEGMELPPEGEPPLPPRHKFVGKRGQEFHDYRLRNP